MALYHYSAQMIQRSKGQSAVAAAAYRAGAVLYDERLGLIHDYSRKGAIAFVEILAPIDAPDWVYDRGHLWNQVEAAENRRDSQPAREINVALPHELTLEQCQQLLKAFVQEQFVARGMIADGVIHDLPHNRHAHILLTTRPLVGASFGLKNRDWSKKELLEVQRKAWADHTNRALEQSGHSVRIDHRSLPEQGVDDRLPQIHLGANVVAMKKKAERKGETFDHPRWERYQEIEQFNTRMRKLEQDIQEETALPSQTVPLPLAPATADTRSDATAKSNATGSEHSVSMEQLQQEAEVFAPVIFQYLKERKVRSLEGDRIWIQWSDNGLTYQRKADSALLLHAQRTGDRWQALPSQGLPADHRQALEQERQRLLRSVRPTHRTKPGTAIGD